MSLPFQDSTSKRTRSEHKSLVVHTMTKAPPPRVSNGDTPEHFTVILDSGATAHMFNTIAYFITYTPCTSTDTHRIRVADGTSIPVVGFGTLPGDHTVMYAPKLAHNILSVDALDAKGYSTLFADGIGNFLIAILVKSSSAFLVIRPPVCTH